MHRIVRQVRTQDAGQTEPVRTRQVIVEEQNGVLNLLPTLPPGAPGTVGARGKRKVSEELLPELDEIAFAAETDAVRLTTDER